MRLIIGDFTGGKLQSGFHETGDALIASQLQELKGQFFSQYREANIRLTEQQLLAAATPDQDIIQAIHSFEQLDVVLNSLGKYSTEWYELHHPHETAHWEQLASEHLPEQGLSELNIGIGSLIAARDAVQAHIERMMEQTLPNVKAVAGAIIGAKLLAAAGSTQRLANFPATTVQLLGAEQALFRHLRNRKALPPKYGILFNHPAVQSVPYKYKGRMARALANNISLASRVDHFQGEFVGDQLKKRVEGVQRALTRS